MIHKTTSRFFIRVMSFVKAHLIQFSYYGKNFELNISNDGFGLGSSAHVRKNMQIGGVETTTYEK